MSRSAAITSCCEGDRTIDIQLSKEDHSSSLLTEYGSMKFYEGSTEHTILLPVKLL